MYLFLALVFSVTTPLWYTAVQFVKGIKNVSSNSIPKALKIISKNLIPTAWPHPDVYVCSSNCHPNHHNKFFDVLRATQTSAFLNCLRFDSFLYFDLCSFSLRISKRRKPACWWELLSSQYCCCLWKSSSRSENIRNSIISDDLQKYLVECKIKSKTEVCWVIAESYAGYIK